MDTSNFDPKSEPQPAISEIDLEIEELERIIAPKLAANHNETIVLHR
jgi:hypothetical protein